MSLTIKGQIQDSLAELETMSITDLLDARLQKFLDMGVYEENGQG
jgi:acetyl-CoA carboxylase alpha subunit